MFASQIRAGRAERLRSGPQYLWHLDEIFVKINGERHDLWQAVDHEGEFLELRDEDARQESGLEIIEENNAEIWSTRSRRH